MCSSLYTATTRCSDHDKVGGSSLLSNNMSLGGEGTAMPKHETSLAWLDSICHLALFDDALDVMLLRCPGAAVSTAACVAFVYASLLTTKHAASIL